MCLLNLRLVSDYLFYYKTSSFSSLSFAMSLLGAQPSLVAELDSMDRSSMKKQLKLIVNEESVAEFNISADNLL